MPKKITASDFASVFVSYGAPDEEFAKKVNQFLIAKGFETWFFPDDQIFGEPLHRLMRHAVTRFERFILICSKNSLERQGVLNEIELALKREAKEGGKSILIPITIDDFVYEKWEPADKGLADEIRGRGIGDFRSALSNESAFEEAMSRLIVSLNW